MRKRFIWCLIVLVSEAPYVGLSLVTIGPGAAAVAGVGCLLVVLIAFSCCFVA